MRSVEQAAVRELGLEQGLNPSRRKAAANFARDGGKVPEPPAASEA